MTPRISLRIQVKFPPHGFPSPIRLNGIGLVAKSKCFGSLNESPFGPDDSQGLRTTFVSKFPLNILHRIFTYASNSFDRARWIDPGCKSQQIRGLLLPFPLRKVRKKNSDQESICAKLWYKYSIGGFVLLIFFTGQIDISSWWCVLSW